MRARIAAYERWAHIPDRAAATAPARRGLLAKFERELDPNELLPAAERTARAELMLRAHMLRMSRAAARSRRRARRASG